MKRIIITRDGSGNVEFETVTVDDTETVFFFNEDSQSEHWPTICAHPVGAAPSDPSSQCFPETPYGCRIAGHGDEQGVINMIQPLAEVNTTLNTATKDQPIAEQQVVTGGLSPYHISGEAFELTNSAGTVTTGSGIGPGLQLVAKADGVWVRGTPSVIGTYYFTVIVNDARGLSLQQVQYKMVVS